MTSKKIIKNFDAQTFNNNKSSNNNSNDNNHIESISFITLLKNEVSESMSVQKYGT